MNEYLDLSTERMRDGNHDHFRSIAADNKSFRDARKRVDNPWKMVIPPKMPQPAMDGQTLQWGENICGLWSYRRYLAINGKWVDMNPTKISYHPLGGKIF